MGRILAATVLLVLAMGSTDVKVAGPFWYFLAPLMVLVAVALIVDEAAARGRRR